MGDTLRTPYFLVDEGLLKKNLEILRQVAQEAGCKILLAQKAFSMFACYPLISRYLSGTTASGLFEARLGREEFPGEVHVFSPAYREEELDELLDTRLPVGEYDTVAGFLMDQLGRIPAENEQPQVRFDHFLFTITRVEDRRIERVHVEILPPPEPPEEAGEEKGKRDKDRDKEKETK